MHAAPMGGSGMSATAGIVSRGTSTGAGRRSGTTVPNFISGEWRKATSTDLLDVIDPATGETIARTPRSGATEVDAAVQSADSAFRNWRRTPVGERVQYLFKLKPLLEQHLDELAQLITA